MESCQIKFRQNSCERANIISRLFFLWTIPLFREGYKKVLELVDLYEPLNSDRSELLGNRLEASWNKRRIKGKQTTLLSVIFVTFWKDFALLSLCSFCCDVILRLGQPFLLGYLLKYFRKNKEITSQEAWMASSGIVILNALNAIFSNHIYHLSFHNGMKVRVSVCSLIYRKALRVSQTALGETSPGKMVNLLANDVNRFDWATFFMNTLWVAPTVTFIVGCLIWIEIGLAGLIGILVVFLIVPMLSYAGKLTSKYRLQTALKTDERVRFMNEIISGVQVIKMYAWEKPFAKLIDRARKLELNEIRKSSYIRALHMISMLFTTRLALFSSMVSIAIIYGPDQITASRIFSISTYFSIVSHLMSQRFSRSIAETAEALVALKRLQKYLNLEEKGSETNDLGKNETNKIKKSNIITVDDANICISMKNVRARWTMSNDKNSIQKHTEHKLSTKNGTVIQDTILTGRQMPTLDNLNIDFPKGKLIGVIGPVGSGKSSLLQAILRELPMEFGSIHIDGTISYACQEPWLFSASVRQNILFGLEYDHDRYSSAVKYCALKRDFEQFENGDLTIVGERGVSLSGGQKARINLARACYRNADIYLLDDPLSAVDAHVGVHIFEKCIGPKGWLAKRKRTRILVTHQVHFLKDADWLIVLKDGKVEVQGSPADLYKCDIEVAELVGITEPPKVNEFERQNSETGSLRSSSSRQSSVLDMTNNNENDEGVRLEASSKGKVKGSLTINYFNSGAHWFFVLTVLLLFIFVQFLASAIDYWVSVWTKQEEARQTHTQDNLSFTLSTEMCIYVQALLVGGLFVFAVVRSISFYLVCLRSSRNIHNSMFQGIISTTMRFFDTNPSGRILNRFSKDLGGVDELLPKSWLDATQNILSITGTVIVAIVVNPYLILPASCLTILFYRMRSIYLKTSLNLKRMEGIVKSPVFTHLGATLTGLSTIRALKVEKTLTREFDNIQDMHSACWYMIVTTTTLFGLALDILCVTFMASVVFYYMLFDKDSLGDKVGLVISQAIALTGVVAWGVRQSAEISNQMMSVERVLEYRDLEPEKQPKQAINIDNWPSKGCIEYRHVFYRYSAEAEPVLSDISFVIKPTEKIGVVGRTGAGKSSLIGSLFRLACVDGDIFIDDINTADIQLCDLRKQIAIIPQDPVLFSGTLRRNLDPFEEYLDADIWQALDCVELKSVVADAFGLQSMVLPHGLNYSVGQRQLLCLARAILRKNRILVLDEATANVDPQTDVLIQQTIREQFTECTTITVAHRLNTIIDSDRVIVMDSGQIMEFDEPYKLLQNENSIFYGMLNAMGEHEFKRLIQIAQQKSDSCKDNSIETTVL